MRKYIVAFFFIIMLFSCTTAFSTGLMNIRNESPKEVRLVAVGDNLIHHTIYKAANKDDKYDFKPFYKDIKPYLGQFDIAFINQESIIGGSDIGLSSYPRFNSPYELGDALVDANFNLISLANNHTLDRGEEAILNTLNYWDNKKVIYSGANRNNAESRIKLFTVNGIDFAFVAYTTTTNGIIIPEDKEYLINYFSFSNAKEDIEKVRSLVDVIIVSMHWGEEYADLPNNEQMEIAKFLSRQGVDLVIGHHPHVIQPIERIADTIVVYSLGNFLSDQVGIDRLIGMAFNVTFTKDKDSNVISISQEGVKLLYRHKDNNQFRVILFPNLTNKILPEYKKYYEKKKKLIEYFGFDAIL